MRQIIFNLDTSDKTLIFNNFVVQGENLATELVFNLSPEFQGYKYLIEFQNNSKTPVVTPELIAVNDVVKYIVTNAVTTQAGILKIQFQAYNDSGKLIKSIVTSLKVSESIQGVTEIMPEAYVPWYLQAVEQANIATAKAEEAAQSAIRAADIMNKASVTLNHQFIDVTARDAYFTANPTELLANLFIKVGTGYQQYINGAWEDVSAIIVELQKAKDVPLEDTENKYVAENIEDALIEIHDDLETHKSAYTSNKEKTDLKIATVDKELNDFQQTLSQVNVNQEAKQSVTGYGVISLPKTSSNGQVSVGLKGNTRTNIAKVNTRQVGQGTSLVDTVNLQAGKTYTVSAYIDTTSTADSGRIRVQDTVINYYLGSTINAGSKGYSKLSFTALQDGLHEIRLQKTGIADANIIYATEVLLEETNEIKPFISGTKSTINAGRFRGIGNNLSRNDDWEQGTLTSAGLDYVDNLGIRTKFRKIESGDYTFKVNNPSQDYLTSQIHWYDVNKTFISRNSSTATTKNFTIPVNAVYYRTYYKNNSTTITPDKVKDLQIQIEKGTTATLYTPYIESTKYFQAKDENGNIVEAKSVPNGTKDEIRVSGGKAELVKRVSDEVVLKGTESWLMVAAMNNETTSLFYVASPSDMYKPALDSVKMFNNNLFPQKLIYSATYTEEGMFISSEELIFVRINNSRLSTIGVSGFKEWLTNNPITLTYQLAEPVEIPIEVSGTLMSYPSGTIYVENVVADAGIYSDKFTILNTDLPIKEIEKISKVDFNTGVETELDVSQAVISTDKLSFTHPDLVNGDIVFTTYFYDVESTQGETTVTYYDSRHTVKDKTLENKFYQWTIEVDNGTPSIKLVEV